VLAEFVIDSPFWISIVNMVMLALVLMQQNQLKRRMMILMQSGRWNKTINQGSPETPEHLKKL
jgi:hypothetical protein